MEETINYHILKLIDNRNCDIPDTSINSTYHIIQLKHCGVLDFEKHIKNMLNYKQDENITDNKSFSHNLFLKLNLSYFSITVISFCLYITIHNYFSSHGIPLSPYSILEILLEYI